MLWQYGVRTACIGAYQVSRTHGLISCQGWFTVACRWGGEPWGGYCKISDFLVKYLYDTLKLSCCCTFKETRLLESVYRHARLKTSLDGDICWWTKVAALFFLGIFERKWIDSCCKREGERWRKKREIIGISFCRWGRWFWGLLNMASCFH